MGVSRLAQREMNKSILQAQGMVLVGMSGVGRWKFQKCHFLKGWLGIANLKKIYKDRLDLGVTWLK